MKWSAQQPSAGLKHKLKELVLVQHLQCLKPFESGFLTWKAASQMGQGKQADWRG